MLLPLPPLLLILTPAVDALLQLGCADQPCSARRVCAAPPEPLVLTAPSPEAILRLQHGRDRVKRAALHGTGTPARINQQEERHEQARKCVVVHCQL